MTFEDYIRSLDREYVLEVLRDGLARWESISADEPQTKRLRAEIEAFEEKEVVASGFRAFITPDFRPPLDAARLQNLEKFVAHQLCLPARRVLITVFEDTDR